MPHKPHSSVYDKTYFIGVPLLVCYISVNIPQRMDIEHIKLIL